MKLHFDSGWLKRAIEREGDHEVGACSPEIAGRARALATARGHKNIDEEIVTASGARVPVWQFYIDEAALASLIAEDRGGKS